MNTAQQTGYVPLSQLSAAQLAEAFGECDYFVYELDYAAINFGTTANASFVVQSDSNFLWQYFSFYATIADAAFTDSTRVIPSINMLIQDTSSGRLLMSAPVPIPNMSGNGQLPFQLPSPRFFRANTQVNVTCTNFDAAVDYTLNLSFIGTKYFNYNP